MRRKINVNCNTWAAVEKLCEDQSKGRTLLTIRGKYPLEVKDQLIVVLRLPDELVLSIAARVERVRPLTDEQNSYTIRLIGLTLEMCARMRSLLLEATAETLKPSYMRVKKVAVGSDTEINTRHETGPVIGNLRLHEQIDAPDRPSTDDPESEDLKN